MVQLTAILINLFSTQLLAVPINCSYGKLNRYDISRDEPDVYYHIENSAMEFADSIRTGMDTWNSVEGAYINFAEISSPDEAFITYKTTYSGATSVEGWGTEEMVMDIGRDYYESRPNTFIRKLMHETAHNFGMGHHLERGGIMFPDSFHDNSFDLSISDELALVRIYPEEGDPLPVGCATVRTGQPAQQLQKLILILLLPLCLIVVRRLVIGKL